MINNLFTVQHQMTYKIGEDLGRIFEVGFNIGILAYIQQHQIKQRFGNLYLQELQQLKFPKMLKRITDKFTDPVQRKIAETWSTFFLEKGFLSGLNFLGEYLQATGWNESQQLRNLEIVYYQCRFNGDNSIGTYEEKTDSQWLEEVLTQFPNLEEEDRRKIIYQYTGKGKSGEFLYADMLMLLRYRRQYRILCVDLSIFSINTSADVKDLNYIELIREILVRDLNYLRSKSVFANLKIDAGNLGFEFSQDLQNYFSAFKYDDKESAKFIQAASYVYSFYGFLQERGILTESNSVVFNAVGYSDRSISSMSVRPENLIILKTCYEIYKHDLSPKEISDARQLVLNRIKRSAYTSFDNGKQLVDALLTITPNQINFIPHQEKITNFFNSVGEVPSGLIDQLGLTGTKNLRQVHTEIVQKALNSDHTYIFLTGNPGIGKTTAIADFLKSPVHLEEGFLFFYASPRKQVNLDIIEKFKDPQTNLLCSDRMICINTNYNLIRDNDKLGRYTVQYVANQPIQGNYSVNFVDSRVIQQPGYRSEKLNRSAIDLIKPAAQKTKGVLSSISEAIYILVNRNISNNIVATVSIQSLKKTDTSDTLKHFRKIFRDAYNQSTGTVIPSQMRQISRRIKHLFIMIDEITGSDGGVEFLNGISEILTEYKLTDPQSGFNTKIIVADASIVDQDVICQHLQNSSAEPDKIYFRRTSQIESQPITLQEFRFKNFPAIAINTNSYPAGNLTIQYKIFIESCKFREKANLPPNSSLETRVQSEILTDLTTRLKQTDGEQVIVYIQNKSRLAELIDYLTKHLEEFNKFVDYLEIHANISEVEKEQIAQCKNQVKVVFMTASGSRGLSFPKAKHILVEIPRFEIEQNLMEIIQVIYRGRGDDQIDKQDKELVFYLSDRSIYYDQESQLSLQESVLNILNILLILKASIMTRIFGYGKIGRDKFMIIPIGGKSVSGAGETFSVQMENLIRELKKEHNRNPSDTKLKQIYTSLQQLLSRAEFTIRDTTETNYLQIRESFHQLFSQKCNPLDGLLELGKIQPGYIIGGILIVPITDKILKENYLIALEDIIKYTPDHIFKQMYLISKSPSYPDNLRSAIKDAIELVEKLREPTNKSQRFEQYSRHFDQYYALPLFAFIAATAMKKYFAENPEEPEDKRFRDILAGYIRQLYPVGNILPIDHRYSEFPFVIFRSYNLAEIRTKIFQDQYILNSYELNVLNLILSKAEDG